MSEIVNLQPNRSFVWSGKEEAIALANAAPSVELFEHHGINSMPDERRRLELPLIDSQIHHIIIGDNLDALKIFHRNERLKFNFIYIDPPYNTGQKLSFNDTHKRKNDRIDTESTWLSMIYARLLAAKKVLAEDGFLFASIDDRQYAELLLMMQEVFGKQNHIGTIKWRKKRKASFLDQHLSTTIEYIIVFSKDASKAPRLIGEAATELTRPVLNASNQCVERLIRKGTKAFCKPGVYKKGIYKNRTLGFELLDDLEVSGGVVLKNARVLGQFRVSQKILDESLFITKKFGLRRNVLTSEKGSRHASDDATNWATNEDAESELKSIFSEKVFTYPKPTGLIQNLLKMCPLKNNESFLCLDFFAGSATLAEAVVALNKEDGGKRVFFCVQRREKLPKPFPHLDLFDISDIAVYRAKKVCERYDEKRSLRLVELA